MIAVKRVRVVPWYQVLYLLGIVYHGSDSQLKTRISLLAFLSALLAPRQKIKIQHNSRSHNNNNIIISYQVYQVYNNDIKSLISSKQIS